MVQLDGGGGGSSDDQQASESEIDQASSSAFRRGGRGALAEPEVEQETTRMQQAQDRDLQEVQRREQQAAEADSGPSGGGRTASPPPAPSRPPEPEPQPQRPSRQRSPPRQSQPSTQDLSPPGTSATVDGGGGGDTSPDPATVEAPSEDIAGSDTNSGGSTSGSGGGGTTTTTTGSGGGTNGGQGGTDTKTITVIGPEGGETERVVDADRDIADTVRELESGQLVGASRPGGGDPSGAGTTGTTVSTGTVSGQGVETGGPGSGGSVEATIDGETVSGSVQDVATAVESSVLADNPNLTAEDVRVTRDEGTLNVELTESGVETLRGQAANREAELNEAALNVEAVEQLAERRRDVSVPGAAIDVEKVEQFAEQQRQADINAARASGAVSAAASIPNKIERRLEQQIEAETGRDVDLDPQDFELVSEDGQQTAQLTQSGVDKVATDPLTDTVPEGIGTRPLEVVPGPLAGLFPGSGLIGAGVEVGEKEPLGPIAKDIGVTRDFGDIDLQVAQFGDRPVTPGRGVARRERTGTKSFETILNELDADVAGAVEPQTPAVQTGDIKPGRAGSAKRTERRSFTGTGQEAAAAFGEATIESIPRFAIGAAKLGKDAADFTVEAGGTEIQELDTLFTSAGQTAINTGSVAAAEGIEAPGVTAGRAAGSLIGSAAIFGGAAAVGPRTSLAARAAIQPGEEALGIGGFSATKAVAGRGTAQRLFPNKEPLIFSEEAFLRGVSGASSRVSARLEAADFESRLLDVDVKQSTLDAVDRAQTRFAKADPRRGREPRLLAEGPIAASSPRAVGRGDLGEGEFVIRPRGEAGSEDVEAPTVEDEFDGESEGGMSVGGGDFRVEVEDAEGRVLQQDIRRADVESRLDAPTEAEFERARRDPAFETRRRFETATDVDPIGRVGVEPIEAAGIDQFGATEPFTQFDQPLGEAVRPDVFQEFDQEFKPPRELELERAATEFELERVGTPTEFRSEGLLDQRQQQEQELEIEQELETEFGEIETELSGKDRTRAERFVRDEDVDHFDVLRVFDRTKDPFAEIGKDLDAVDMELSDLE